MRHSSSPAVPSVSSPPRAPAPAAAHGHLMRAAPPSRWPLMRHGCPGGGRLTCAASTGRTRASFTLNAQATQCAPHRPLARLAGRPHCVGPLSQGSSFSVPETQPPAMLTLTATAKARCPSRPPPHARTHWWGTANGQGKAHQIAKPVLSSQVLG